MFFVAAAVYVADVAPVVVAGVVVAGVGFAPSVFLFMLLLLLLLLWLQHLRCEKSIFAKPSKHSVLCMVRY